EEKAVTQLVAQPRLAPRHSDAKLLKKMAEPTGFEPATSDVTGRRSNQLNYDSALRHRRFSIADCRLINSLIGNWKLTIGMSGGRGGTRTPNLFLVREAVYH